MSKCEQTDFGAWVACVTKVQIVEFITQVYMGKESRPSVGERLKDLDNFITNLKANKTYGLVATEW